MGPARDYGKRIQPSRAKPRGPRSVAEARQELRALGSRLLELALLEPDARPPRAMTEWVGRLARELSQGQIDGATNRLLLREIAIMHTATRVRSRKASRLPRTSAPPSPMGAPQHPGERDRARASTERIGFPEASAPSLL